MYPKTVKLFIPWSKAMVAGATVAKPSYSRKSHRKKRSARVTRRRRNSAKKD